MDDLFKNPVFQDLLKQHRSRHETAILIGEIIRRDYPKPLEAFSQLSEEAIATALIATCSTEQEIGEVLLAAGFKSVSVSVMEEP